MSQATGQMWHSRYCRPPILTLQFPLNWGVRVAIRDHRRVI